MHDEPSWRGKRVTVMGLGRFGGGVGVTRWLAARGARIVVTDLSPPQKLEESIAAIADCDVELHLGRHEMRDFRETDLLVVNPAVPESSEFVRAARDAGVEVTTEINLFVQRCAGTIVGVTGSVGKSTVTAMIGHVLSRSLEGRRVWVGGNLGCSLLADLPEIANDDVVVLELSSFQLERTPGVEWSPRIAVLTRLGPNHLDWHGGYDAYVAAKMNLVRFQQGPRDSVLHHKLWEPSLNCQSDRWSYEAVDGTPTIRHETEGEQATRWTDLQLGVPGQHNVENAAAALGVAHLLGVPRDQAARTLESFAGLPHRLEFVGRFGGVGYYNDSKSTAPEAMITAVDAIDAPLLLILGGYDKQIDLTSVAQTAADRAKFAACIGQTGARIAKQIGGFGGSTVFFESLEAAMAACRERAEPGDAIVLSPACASWGMFTDFRARGEAFTRLARADAGVPA